MRFACSYIVVFVILASLSACTAPTVPAVAPTQTSDPGRGLTIQGSLDGVEIQRKGTSNYEPLTAGESVYTGDNLRSTSSASAPLAELRGEDGTAIIIAPGANLRIELLSPSLDPSQTRLYLEKGALVAAADQPLGEGFLEVKTANGLAAIHGSAMSVSFSSDQTTVACLDGSASLTGVENTVVLPAGYQSSVSPQSANNDPTPAEKFEENLAKKDPLLWQVISDRYYHPGIEQSPTPDLRPSKTPVPTWTPTLTSAPTWTPFVLEASPTPKLSGTIPTRRPTTTAAPGATGSTPEELANQGVHTYQVSCQSWNECVCDSANAVPQVEMLITFTGGGVTLAEKDGKNSLNYTRLAPNLYSVSDSGVIAEITFLEEGWEFWVTRDGIACQLQTFSMVK